MDQVVGAPVSFNVLVEWDNLDRYLSFDVEGWNNEVTIKSVHVHDGDGEDGYSGPIFDELDDPVKEGFYDYLEDRLVSPDFGTWVTRYAYFKEMAAYGDWLQKVRSIL